MVGFLIYKVDIQGILILYIVFEIKVKIKSNRYKAAYSPIRSYNIKTREHYTISFNKNYNYS